jgi:glycerol kinase
VHLRHRRLRDAQHRRAPGPSQHGLLTTVGWQLGERTTYCLEGSAFMAGAVVQWLRDGLGILTRASEIEALAAASTTAAASSWCPRTPASAPRTGAPTPAA